MFLCQSHDTMNCASLCVILIFSVCLRTYNKDLFHHNVWWEEKRENRQGTREMFERDKKKKLADR